MNQWLLTTDLEKQKWKPAKRKSKKKQGNSRRQTLKTPIKNFPGGAVVKNPPANAGDMGLSPGLGRSHMLWSN